MTPNKILSLPVYLTGSTLGIVASILVIPGGLVMALAIGIYWLADRMSKSEGDDINYDISQYDRDIGQAEFLEAGSLCDTDSSHRCGNCFYDDACLTVEDDWCPHWVWDGYDDES
jgi:hypothetical protein